MIELHGASEASVILITRKKSLLGVGPNGRALAKEITAAEKKIHESSGSPGVIRMRFSGDSETGTGSDIGGIVQSLIMGEHSQACFLKDCDVERAFAPLVKDGNPGLVK
jgi:hypothetical protein